MNIKGRKFDAELAHDLGNERTEVLRVLAGALAEQPDIHLGYEELLDPVVLAIRAAGRLRELAAALELVSHPAIARRPGEHLVEWARRFNGLVDAAIKRGSDGGWRTADSAPRDGSWFLAYRVELREPWRVFIAYWHDPYPYEDKPAYWYSIDAGGPCAFTHWMPLPSAPGKGVGS